VRNKGTSDKTPQKKYQTSKLIKGENGEKYGELLRKLSWNTASRWKNITK
jgi:hypothetical protein